MRRVLFLVYLIAAACGQITNFPVDMCGDAPFDTATINTQTSLPSNGNLYFLGMYSSAGCVTAGNSCLRNLQNFTGPTCTGATMASTPGLCAGGQPDATVIVLGASMDAVLDAGINVQFPITVQEKTSEYVGCAPQKVQCSPVECSSPGACYEVAGDVSVTVVVDQVVWSRQLTPIVSTDIPYSYAVTNRAAHFLKERGDANLFPAPAGCGCNMPRRGYGAVSSTCTDVDYPNYGQTQFKWPIVESLASCDDISNERCTYREDGDPAHGSCCRYTEESDPANFWNGRYAHSYFVHLQDSASILGMGYQPLDGAPPDLVNTFASAFMLSESSSFALGDMAYNSDGDSLCGSSSVHQGCATTLDADSITCVAYMREAFSALGFDAAQTKTRWQTLFSQYLDLFPAIEPNSPATFWIPDIEIHIMNCGYCGLGADISPNGQCHPTTSQALFPYWSTQCSFNSAGADDDDTSDVDCNAANGDDPYCHSGGTGVEHTLLRSTLECELFKVDGASQAAYPSSDVVVRVYKNAQQVAVATLTLDQFGGENSCVAPLMGMTSDPVGYLQIDGKYTGPTAPADGKLTDPLASDNYYVGSCSACGPAGCINTGTSNPFPSNTNPSVPNSPLGCPCCMPDQAPINDRKQLWWFMDSQVFKDNYDTSGTTCGKNGLVVGAVYATDDVDQYVDYASRNSGTPGSLTCSRIGSDQYPYSMCRPRFTPCTIGTMYEAYRARVEVQESGGTEWSGACPEVSPDSDLAKFLWSGYDPKAPNMWLTQGALHYLPPKDAVGNRINTKLTVVLQKGIIEPDTTDYSLQLSSQSICTCYFLADTISNMAVGSVVLTASSAAYGRTYSNFTLSYQSYVATPVTCVATPSSFILTASAPTASVSFVCSTPPNVFQAAIVSVDAHPIISYVAGALAGTPVTLNSCCENVAASATVCGGSFVAGCPSTPQPPGPPTPTPLPNPSPTPTPIPGDSPAVIPTPTATASPTPTPTPGDSPAIKNPTAFWTIFASLMVLGLIIVIVFIVCIVQSCKKPK